MPLKLKVAEALSKDVGRGVARMGPEDLERLGVTLGETVQISAKRKTVCKALPAYKDLRGQSRIQLDGLARENVGAGLDEVVTVEKIAVRPAEKVVLAPTGVAPAERDLKYIGSLLDGLPVLEGDHLRATLFGSRWATFKVESTTPKGPVVISPGTVLVVGKPPHASSENEILKAPAYEDIGGLKPQLHRIREMIELPLRHPEVFERLGIDAPKGVLLFGPPGCGKTLIARAIARETEASFFSVSGPEIVHKFYGESEAHLRKIFDDAARKSPSIIFLDEIDAIAPRRENVVGEVEKRIVAQLLALMDGLNRRAHVVVIAATNIPNAIDPALRRPGRFDREITIPIPDRNGRLEILEVHSRGMPLAGDVALPELADMTHGYVGADLEGLCREAAMGCLRRLLSGQAFDIAEITHDKIASLQVERKDFLVAYQEIEPSAIREVFVEVPDTRWTDVGGLTDIKKRLVEAVQWPISHGELFARAGVKPPKGVLLSGPPGCGKTLLARAVATESGVNFISVKGPALLSKFVGDSEKGVREIFHKARQAAPCVIFFDEIDALVPARSEGSAESPVAERVLSQFLAEMDGVDGMNGVVVLAATNRIDRLDPAVLRPGRFDDIFEIGGPDIDARQEIFTIHLKGKPVEKGVRPSELSAKAEGFSGAEVAAVCTRAAMRAVRRVINAGPDAAPPPPLLITRDDLSASLEEVSRG